MTRASSPGATAWSLFLAFLGAIATVYVVYVVSASISASYYGPLFTFVFFPLLGAIVVVPVCLLLTLVAGACFVLAHRWVRSSRLWASVVAVAMTIVVCSAFYLALGLLLPAQREPLEVLEFSLALAVIVTVCAVRIGKPRQEDAFHSGLAERDSSG